MKQYKVISVHDEDEVFGTYTTKADAQEALIDYVKEKNGENEEDADNGIDTRFECSIFDFKMIEFEVNEPSEFITDYETAREYLGGKPNREFNVSKNVNVGTALGLEDVTTLVDELNPSHVKAVIAFNRLATIAQAWNKIDGFVPDFSNWEQHKWFPWFMYDKDAAGLVCSYSNRSPSAADATIGSRLCFKSKSRAKEFGEMFVDLYNDMFLLDC